MSPIVNFGIGCKALDMPPHVAGVMHVQLPKALAFYQNG